MDYGKEFEKATKDMTVETAKKLAIQFRAQIEAREKGYCACGSPCRNRIGHEAADRLALLAVEKVARGK